VLRGKIHKPFASREAPIASSSSSILDTLRAARKSLSWSSQLQREIGDPIGASHSQSQPSLYCNTVPKRISDREIQYIDSNSRLLWTPANTERFVGVHENLDNYHDAREHGQNGMSPWFSMSIRSTPGSTPTDPTKSTPTDLNLTKQITRAKRTGQSVKKKDQRTRLPSISKELEGLFALGSRIETDNNNNHATHTALKNSAGSNNNNFLSGIGRPAPSSRALSPFSEWVTNQRLGSPDSNPPPMTADCAVSEMYQLHYNRASTVTASGGKRRTKQEAKAARKAFNKKRAMDLLEYLKKTIQKKQKMKKQTLVEQKVFKDEYKLREQVMRPMSKPSNCQLPLSLAPNHHPSHQSYTSFYPKTSSSLTALDAMIYDRVSNGSYQQQQQQQTTWKTRKKHLSHARLSAYRFNILNTPYDAEKAREKAQFQKALLESREKRSKHRNKLAASFWTRLGNQEEAEKILSTTLKEVGVESVVESVESEREGAGGRRRKKGGLVNNTMEDEDFGGGAICKVGTNLGYFEVNIAPSGPNTVVDRGKIVDRGGKIKTTNPLNAYRDRRIKNGSVSVEDSIDNLYGNGPPGSPTCTGEEVEDYMYRSRPVFFSTKQQQDNSTKVLEQFGKHPSDQLYSSFSIG
jgi:hypothetical protein